MKRYLLKNCSIDIVHGCQLRCVGCPNSILKPKIETMTLSDFQACMKNLGSVKYVDTLRLFNFGEPFLHPNLASILDITKYRPFKTRTIELSTNAQYFTDSTLREVIKSKVLTQLVVSCDGDSSASDYERLRPPAKWENLLEFLKIAKSLRDSYDPGLNLITRTICESSDARDKWRMMLRPLGWKPKFRLWIKLPISVKNPSAEKPLVKGLCHFLQLPTLYIDYDGSVVPCCAHPRAAILGNIINEKYDDIANGAKRKEFRQNVKKERQNLHICSQCGMTCLTKTLLKGIVGRL